MKKSMIVCVIHDIHKNFYETHAILPSKSFISFTFKHLDVPEAVRRKLLQSISLCMKNQVKPLTKKGRVW